jgi:MFS family permease
MLTWNSMYTASLSAGVSGGIIISGLITIGLSWRYIYFIAAAIIGALLLLVFFTFPETAYNRDPNEVAANHHDDSKSFPSDLAGGRIEKSAGTHQVEHVRADDSAPDPRAEDQERHRLPGKRTFAQDLRPYNGTFSNESLWKIFYRPIVLLVVPSILWATLAMSVTIGFLVAITSNFASAFAKAYGFAAWQSGLCFISGFLFTMAGIFGGGVLSDWIADYFTKRNNGLREPEMRLPAVTLGLVCAPLGLALYGSGIEHELHWIVPTLGLGFLSFSISQATNVTLVYVIDSYRPIAGETVVTQLAFKCETGPLLLC